MEGEIAGEMAAKRPRLTTDPGAAADVGPSPGLLKVMSPMNFPVICSKVLKLLDGDGRRAVARALRPAMGEHEWELLVATAGLRTEAGARESAPELSAVVVGETNKTDAFGSYKDGWSLVRAVGGWPLTRLLESTAEDVSAATAEEKRGRATGPLYVGIKRQQMIVWRSGWANLGGGRELLAGALGEKDERFACSTDEEDGGGGRGGGAITRAVAARDGEGRILWETELPSPSGDRSDDVSVSLHPDEEGGTAAVVFEDMVISPLFDVFHVRLSDGCLLGQRAINNVDATFWASENLFQFRDGYFFSASTDEGLILITVWDTRRRGPDDFWEAELRLELGVFYLRGMEVHRERGGAFLVNCYFASVPGFEGVACTLHRVRLGGPKPQEEVAAFRLSGATYLASNGQDVHYLEFRLGDRRQIVAATMSFLDGLTDRKIHRVGERGRLGELLPCGGGGNGGDGGGGDGGGGDGGDGGASAKE